LDRGVPNNRDDPGDVATGTDVYAALIARVDTVFSNGFPPMDGRSARPPSLVLLVAG